MRDLLLIVGIALIAIFIWIGIEIFQEDKNNILSQEILEISLPLNGRIDTDFIDSLSNPANE